tara:strand:- start:47 stop:646 length:600 start_codon:yes stop_codon:yes gene_type:complete
MLNLIFDLEYRLFQIINNYLSNPMFDQLFIFFHSAHKNKWIMLLIISILFFYIYKHKRNRMFFMVLIIGFIVTDQIGRVIKNYEMRQRPYMTLDKDEIKLLIEQKKDEDGDYKNTPSSKKSFPSNHTANAFFIATFLSYMYDNNKKYLITLAVLIGISRIYIGVHYPIDVLFGAILGISIAYILNKLMRQKLIGQNIIR